MKSNEKRLFEMMSKIDTSFNEVNNRNRANSKYTHFAVIKTTGKIVNGWDYNGYDQSELNAEKKHYFLQDIKDMQIDPKIVTILTKKYLLNRGIDPYDFNNWNKDQSIYTL